jgi:hypothetical protein
LKLKGGQDPDKCGVASVALETEYTNNLEEQDKVMALIRAVLSEPQYTATIISELKRLESVEGKEVPCEDLIESMCELWRVGGLDKGVIQEDNPTETEFGMMDPGFLPRTRDVYTVRKEGT